MSTNDPQRKIPTPADLDPNRSEREAERQAAYDRIAEGKHRAEAMAEAILSGPEGAAPSPSVMPGHVDPPEFVRPPSLELTEEQRTRVEALHAARRVLGAPRITDGQLPAGWAWQAVELASYIVTGEADGGPVEGDEQAGAEEGSAPAYIDLDKPLPAGLPPHVAAALQKLQGAFRPGGVLPSPEERAKRTRDYVEQYRDKPDGLQELNAQGYFPVDGSEPPRSEPLHDVHCNRWFFRAALGQWARETPLTEDERQSNKSLSTSYGAWGPALAEFGPFHVCI